MDFRGALGLRMQDLSCGIMSAGAAAGTYLAGLIDPRTGNPIPFPQAPEITRRLACGLGVNPIPPFTTVPGGQCQGTLYLVTVEGQCRLDFPGGGNPVIGTVTWRSVNQQNQAAAIGPIGSPINIGVTTGGTNAPFGPPLEWSDGSQDGIFGLNAISNSNPAYNPAAGNNTIESAQITNIQVIAGPDNCGDTPAGGGPPEPDLCWDEANGQTVCQNVPSTPLPPRLGPGNNIIFPRRFDFPFGPVEVNLNIGTGDINIGVPVDDGSPTGDSSCCDSPSIPAAPPPPLPPGVPPPPDDGNEYYGILVTSEQVGNISATLLANQPGPVIAAPRAGNVCFAVKSGTTRAWTADVPVKNGRQFVPVNAPFYATGWSLHPEPGWQMTAVGIKVPARVILS
jgi:hypothetical protein